MVIVISNMASQIQATEASNYQGVRIKTEPIDTSYDFSNVHVKQEISTTPASFQSNYNDNTEMPQFSFDFSNIHVKQEICSTPMSNARNHNNIQMPEIKQEVPLLDVKKEEPFTISNNLVKQENTNKNKQRYRPKPMQNIYHKNFNNGVIDFRINNNLRINNYGGYYQNGYDNGYYNNGYDYYGYGYYHGYRNYYNGYHNNNNYQNNRRHRGHQRYRPRNNATRNYTNSQRSNNLHTQNYSYSQPYAFSNATHFPNSYASYQAAYSNCYHHNGWPNYNIPGSYYANWQLYMTLNQSQGPIRHQTRTKHYYHANKDQNKNFKKTKNRKKNLVKEENKNSTDSVTVEYAVKLEQSVKIEQLETDEKPPMGSVNPLTASGPVYPNPFNSSNIALTSNASSFYKSESFDSRITVSSNAECSINVPSCSGSTNQTNSSILFDTTNLPQNSDVLNTSVNSDSSNSIIGETTLKVMNLPKIWNFENIKNFLEMIDIESPECTTLMRYDRKMTARLDFGSKEVLLQAKEKLDGLDIGGAKLETLGGIALNDTNAVNILNDDKLLWRPDLDINQRDPIGLYGLRRKFLLSLQIKPPLEQWVSVTNFNCDKSALCEILQTAGRVVICDVITSDGCNRALVMYSHPLEAVQAISSLHNKPPSNLHITMDTAPDGMITPFRKAELKHIKPTYSILEELRNHLNGLRTPLCDSMFYEPKVLVPQRYDV